jgi:serine/threonine-protein kinase
MIGTTLAHYRVTAALGAGGMGEVWRAEDTKLGREVALKVLPEEFAKDPERMARFEREAKVLASLNHPNIATLYGLESAIPSGTETETGTETVFLAMELVEGEDLSERIKRGPIPVDEAIPIALQIAEALEAAHEAGIVHRDLKPANIKLTEDGVVKVLDFGLAKAWETESGDSSLSLSPTLTRHATVEGVILGTAAYMSPEQARGKKVDKRADIWSFGVVLWEMLTGHKLFDGETVSDVLAAVLRAEPDLDLLPAATPPHLTRLVTRCLERDPRGRLQCIGDARVELQANDDKHELPQAATPSTSNRLGLAIGVVGLMLASAAIAWALLSRAQGSSGPVHVEISEAAFKEFTNSAISPDGNWLAYVLGQDDAPLQIRSLGSFAVQTVPELLDVENPFFSPDGKWVAYFDPVADGVGKVSVAGGSPIQLPGVTVTSSFNTGAWHPDGFLVISGAMVDGRAWSGLAKMSEAGGVATILTTLGPDEVYHHEPNIVPGGDWVVYTNEDSLGWSVWAVSLVTGETQAVVDNAATPMVLDSGHLLVYRYLQRDVVSYLFDAKMATVEGEPTVVLQGVGNGPREGGRYAVSKSGTLIYTPLNDGSMLATGRAVVWVDRHGVVEQIVEERSSWVQPRISPDGRHLLLRRVLTPACSLWTYDLTRGALARITFDEDTHDPLWDPTGTSVFYAGDTEPKRILRSVAADGTGEPRSVVEAEVSLRASSWSQDGRRLALGARGVNLNDDIWVLDADVGPEPKPFLDSRFAERYPTFSPDGRWLAYASDESGRWEVFVRPYPGTGGRIQVSTGGGLEPRWSGDGSELFFRAENRMMVVMVTDDGDLVFGRPQPLFEDHYLRPSKISADVHSYDVSADGSRFLMIQRDDQGAMNADLKVVLGWLDSLDLE